MDRFDIHHEQYLQEEAWLHRWTEDSIAYLLKECADYLPWNDAAPTTSGPHPQESAPEATGFQPEDCGGPVPPQS